MTINFRCIHLGVTIRKNPRRRRWEEWSYNTNSSNLACLYKLCCTSYKLLLYQEDRFPRYYYSATKAGSSLLVIFMACLKIRYKPEFAKKNRRLNFTQNMRVCLKALNLIAIQEYICSGLYNWNLDYELNGL